MRRLLSELFNLKNLSLELKTFHSNTLKSYKFDTPEKHLGIKPERNDKRIIIIIFVITVITP